MKVSIDSVEINQVREALNIADGINKISEAQRWITNPDINTIAVLHLMQEQDEEIQPISIEIRKELLEAVIQFIFNREMTTLNRMGIDLKE